MKRLAVLLAVLLVLTACTDDEKPEPERQDASEPSRSLNVVEFANGSFGPSREIQGCASMAGVQDAGYTRPVLLWLKVGTTAPLRLLPPSYAPRSNSIDTVTGYVGPDPGPEAPYAGVSIGEAGAGPTADRLEYDTHLIGDERDSPEGLAAAQASWSERVELRGKGVALDPGDHYLFVEVDPAKGGMDLHGLRAAWVEDGARDEQFLGSLSLRVRCGG